MTHPKRRRRELLRNLGVHRRVIARIGAKRVPDQHGEVFTVDDVLVFRRRNGLGHVEELVGRPRRILRGEPTHPIVMFAHKQGRGQQDPGGCAMTALAQGSDLLGQSASAVWPVVPDVCVAVSACLILLIDVYGGHKRRGLSATLTMFALLVGVVLTSRFGMVLQRELLFNGMYVADALGTFLKLVAFVTMAIAVFYSQNYLEQRQMLGGEYYVPVSYTHLGRDRGGDHADAAAAARLEIAGRLATGRRARQRARATDQDGRPGA